MAATRRYRRAAALWRTLDVAGRSSFLDMLDAERSPFSAEDALLKNRVAEALGAMSGTWAHRPNDRGAPRFAGGPRTTPSPGAAIAADGREGAADQAVIRYFFSR